MTKLGSTDFNDNLVAVLNYQRFIKQGKAESSEFFTFEPYTLGQKVRASLQNTSENWTIMLTVAAAMWQPSFISIFFMILTCNLNISASFKIQKRLTMSVYLMYFNMAVLLFIILWKVTKIQTMDNNPATAKKYRQEIRFYESTGFAITNMVHDADNNKYSYSYDFFLSFLFEMMIFVVYCLTIDRIQKKRKNIEFLKKNPLDVILVKNYEMKKFFDTDDEDDEPAASK